MIDLSNYSCDKCKRAGSWLCKNCWHTAGKKPTRFKHKKKIGCETPEYRRPTIHPNPNLGWQPTKPSDTKPPNPPTSGSNAVKPPERGLRIKVNLIDNACDINIVDIIETFKSQQFICSMCEKIISPEVKVNQDSTIEVTSETGELRGGLGNKVIKNHICSECMKNISLIYKEN